MSNGNNRSLSEQFSAAMRQREAQPDLKSETMTLAAHGQTTKSPRITLRLTEEENTQLRKLASGVTMSSYVRECLFGKNAPTRKTRRRHQPLADEVALARVLALLGETKMANNLNQMAHRANMGELVMNQETLLQIEEAYQHIQTIRTALIKAIGLIEA